MKSQLRNFCLLVFFSTGTTVIMEPKEQIVRNAEEEEKDFSNFGEHFGSCLSEKSYGTFECASRAALGTLRTLNEKEELNFGSVQLERNELSTRELPDLGYTSENLENVIKTVATLMERRRLRWDLDYLYPGLQMRVGPTLNANGILEFVLNERAPSYGDRQAGAGNQLARHLVLPFLLGFKFNLAALIPLLFGALIIISKKALLLTKLALLLSGFLGWNSLTNATPGPQVPAFNGFGGYGGHLGTDSHYDDPLLHHQHLHHSQYFPGQAYKISPYVTFGPYARHVVREIVNVYDSKNNEDKNSRNGKNFAWTTKDD